LDEIGGELLQKKSRKEAPDDSRRAPSVSAEDANWREKGQGQES